MERWRDICIYPSGQVRRGQVVVRLSPVKWRIFRHLLAACGSEVSTDRLMGSVYGNCNPPLDGVLATHISFMRPKIAKLGVRIVRRIGFGWRIVDEEIVALNEGGQTQWHSRTFSDRRRTKMREDLMKTNLRI